MLSFIQMSIRYSGKVNTSVTFNAKKRINSTVIRKILIPSGHTLYSTITINSVSDCGPEFLLLNICRIKCNHVPLLIFQPLRPYIVFHHFN